MRIVALATIGLLMSMPVQAAKGPDGRNWDRGDGVDYRKKRVSGRRDAEDGPRRHRVPQPEKMRQQPPDGQQEASLAPVGRAPLLAPPEVSPLDMGPPANVDDYLCGVYNRMPEKIDGAGNFTWKDKKAADRLRMTVCQYAIEGMAPDLREALYAFGRQADDKGIRWSFLSAYRDEYRQRLAEGIKAAPCGSMHSDRTCGTKGYGRGKAADLWLAAEDGRPAHNPNPLFQFIDSVGRLFGLSRPMPGYDPAHVQVGSGLPRIAATLRAKRYTIAGYAPPVQRAALAMLDDEDQPRRQRRRHRH